MKLAVAVAATVAALAWAAIAFAHAEPAEIHPGDGALLTTPPPTIQIVMTQDMARQAGGNDIDVFDSAGKEVTTAAAVIDNADRRKLTVQMPATLTSGTYTVKWRSLSAEDGDDASGELSFTYDPQGTPNEGKVKLQESLLGGDTPEAQQAPENSADFGGGNDGVTWILVLAVAVAMFVLGSGGTFLLVQKRP